MLRKITDLPYGVDGLDAIGKVSKEDYESVFEPLLQSARGSGRRLRFLYEFGPHFEGFTASGAWEDFKVGLSSMKSFEGCAIVSDIDWIRRMAQSIGYVLPCPVRVFDLSARSNAGEWLQSLPAGSSVSYRIVSEASVVVVDVKQALGAFDFEPLILSVDSWLEAGGELRGIVFHARAFPGWENLGNFFHHVRFVHDHHRKLRRVALASDAELAGLTRQLSAHFASAQVSTFGYEAVDAAVAWAGTSTNTPRARAG